MQNYKDSAKPKGLDVSGAAIQTGASQMQQQIERWKQAQEKASQQLRQLQYVPIDGVIDGNAYLVGPNDGIRLQTWGATMVDELCSVSPDGMVVLPGYGAVEVGGKSWNEAKAKIEIAIKEAYNPSRWAVTLASVRIFLAHITGAVYFPSSYQVGATQRVWDIIQLAGGTTLLGDLTDIEVLHRNGDTTFVDLSPYLSMGDLKSNPYLQDGDVVIVMPFDGDDQLIKVYSEGIRSGFYGLNSGETVRKFAQRNGIFFQSPELSKVQILRADSVIALSLLSSDLPLQNGDVVIFSTHLDSIFVGGIVTKGGTFPYYPGVSYQAYIAMASGPSEKGSVTRVSIYREGEKMSPKEAGDLLPGDVIIVHYSFYERAVDAIETISRIVSSGLTVYYLIDRFTQ